MNLMDRFADPDLIMGMTMPEKLAGTGVTAIMGMGVTFVVLFLLWGSISLMNQVMAKLQKKTADGITQGAPTKTLDVGMPTVVSNREITAVISAAVHAYRDSDDIVLPASISIRQIRRPSGDNWSQAGRWENMR